MFIKALSLCFVKLEILSFVVRGVWMSAWVDGVLLSAVDSALLTDSVIVNSLLGQYARILLSLVAFCSTERVS